MRTERAARCGTWTSSLADDVVAWRHRQLVSAGFSDGLAAQLAGISGIDLHDMLNLVDHGCPPELAARILEPLTECDLRR
jgi:hypothetical protein